MRQPNEDWSEFDWERALRESDEFAARYFRLLKRFCDFPGANELITTHMGPEFKDEMPECDFECQECPQRWDCEFAAAIDWAVAEEEMPAEGEPVNLPGFEEEEEEGMEEGDPAMYEADPAFVVLRQAAIGWCNIYAAILSPDARPQGLGILYHIGRSLANLAYSINDGMFEQSDASIAFAKRSLGHLNKAVGLLNELINEKNRSKKILSTIRSHLIRAHDALIDHLHRCRSGATGMAGAEGEV